jgi:hypothetical protein
LPLRRPLKLQIIERAGALIKITTGGATTALLWIRFHAHPKLTILGHAATLALFDKAIAMKALP